MSRKNPCLECNRDFDHVNNLNAHLRARGHHKRHQCGKCERCFNNERSLARHVQAVHYHPCQTCKMEFDSEAALNEHDDEFHSKKCAHCERVFRTDEGREQHRKAVHRIHCRICDILIDDEQTFANHNREFHTVRCDECPTRVFKSISALEAHWKSPIHFLQCMKCKMKFKNERVWFQHSKSPHLFKCSHCSSSFGTKGSLDKHHQNKHRLPCQWCAEIFETTQILEAHLNSAHITECQKCQRVFENPSELVTHIDSCGTIQDSAVPQSPVISLQDPADPPSPVISLPDSTVPRSPVISLQDLAVPRSPVLSLEDLTVSHSPIIPIQDPSIPPSPVISRLPIEENPIEEYSVECGELLCPMCDEICKGSAAVIQHILIKHLYRCHDCTAYFELEIDLLAHIYQAHKQQQKPVSQAPVCQRIACPKCDQDFSTSDEFYHHALNSHHLKCAQCPGLLLASMEQLAEHSRIAHAAPAAKSSAVLSRKRQTSDSHNHGFSLEQFSTYSEGETLIPTAQASPEISSPRKSDLPKSAQLAKSHFGVDFSFRCEECDGIFETAQELERHTYHSPFHGVKEIKCHECNVEFLTQVQLLQHIEAKPHQTRWVLSLI